MHDQSYTKNSLNNLFSRGDFNGVQNKDHNKHRDKILAEARVEAIDCFSTKNPIRNVTLKKKSAYKIVNTSDQLVIRKMSENLKRHLTSRPTNRNRVTANLKRLLEESVPYTVVRLDIRHFYESINTNELIQQVEKFSSINPKSILQLQNLLAHYHRLGGSGIPRGVASSSLLADLYMQDFDHAISSMNRVYYYSRYVDDIILVVNPSIRGNIIKDIENELPLGLTLNSSKTRCCSAYPQAPLTDRKCYTCGHLIVEFLGYEFTVRAPEEKPRGDTKRNVSVEISKRKRQRIKMRMIRSLISYSKNNDFSLLFDRIKYLTSNFQIVDKNTGKPVLAGIYYGYPLLADNSVSLQDLDRFKRSIIFFPHNRITGVSKLLAQSQKRSLLRYSFIVGHKNKTFINFSAKRIKEIRECWKYD